MKNPGNINSPSWNVNVVPVIITFNLLFVVVVVVRYSPCISHSFPKSVDTVIGMIVKNSNMMMMEYFLFAEKKL